MNGWCLYRLTKGPKLATQKGLEPSTSSVTGWHSNQLNYQAANGGTNRDRTCDPLLVRQVLSQLSYNPGFFGRRRGTRTPGPMVPNQVRYQTALYLDNNNFIKLKVVDHQGLEPQTYRL